MVSSYLQIKQPFAEYINTGYWISILVCVLCISFGMSVISQFNISTVVRELGSATVVWKKWETQVRLNLIDYLLSIHLPLISFSVEAPDLN